jgi:hypothetical protein
MVLHQSLPDPELKGIMVGMSSTTQITVFAPKIKEANRQDQTQHRCDEQIVRTS